MDEEIQMKLLVLQVMIGIHLKEIGERILHLHDDHIPNGKWDKEFISFEKKQKAFDEQTAAALGLMAKLYPEIVEQLIPREH